MTRDEKTVLMIKGAISELPADQQKKCLEVAELLRKCCAASGDIGHLALALVGAERAARE